MDYIFKKIKVSDKYYIIFYYNYIYVKLLYYVESYTIMC